VDQASAEILDLAQLVDEALAGLMGFASSNGFLPLVL
jgi:hypothetical protein